MTKCVPPRNRLKNSIPVSLADLFCLAHLAWRGRTGRVPARPLTLYDCIALALNESPVLEASRLDVASATEEARAARGEVLPQINATASYELFGGSPTDKFGIVNAGIIGRCRKQQR